MTRDRGSSRRACGRSDGWRKGFSLCGRSIRYGFIQPKGGGGKDMVVHISAVEQAGLSTLNEGQSIEYEIESNRGKASTVKLKVK